MRDYPESSNDYSKVYSEKWIQNVILQNKGKFGLSLFSSIFRSLVLLLPTLLVKQIINRSIPQGNIPILILLSCVNVSIYFVTTTLIILDLHLEKYILDAFGTLRRDLRSRLFPYRRPAHLYGGACFDSAPYPLYARYVRHIAAGQHSDRAGPLPPRQR